MTRLDTLWHSKWWGRLSCSVRDAADSLQWLCGTEKWLFLLQSAEFPAMALCWQVCKCERKRKARRESLRALLFLECAAYSACSLPNLTFDSQTLLSVIAILLQSREEKCKAGKRFIKTMSAIPKVEAEIIQCSMIRIISSSALRFFQRCVIVKDFIRSANINS